MINSKTPSLRRSLRFVALYLFAIGVLFFVICLLLPSALAAAEMKDKMDCAANVKLLDSHFTRFGYSTLKTITREKQGVRIRLPSGTKDVGQTGIYSYFQLAGDFEFSAAYEMIDLPVPKVGYGASFGIAVETKDERNMYSLARGHQVKTGTGYLVTKGVKDDAGKWQFHTDLWPAAPKKGKLMLRREQKEIVCLVADKPGDELRELARHAFPDMTVRTVRLFGDPGESPTAVDARFSNIQVRAEEITGGVPQRDETSNFWWWMLAAAALAAGVGYFIYRWRYGDEDEPEPTPKRTPPKTASRPAGKPQPLR
jgi:hypothetical protein